MRPLIAGNWKMHGNIDWVSKPSEFAMLMPASERENIDVLICPPMPFIAPMVKTCSEAGIHLGAQNCHAAESGAHTGEVSAGMLKSAGANFIIVGHSERRADGENNANVSAKAQAAAKAGLTPIICVGESLEIREAGQAEAVVSQQIQASVPNDITDYVLAYEPIWAIGTGKTATVDDIKAMHLVIRKLVGPAVEEILGTDNVNGALIGGASLKMESLVAIARAA